MTEPRYDVVWPLGRSSSVSVGGALRTSSLEGGRVGFVWNYLYCGPEIFEETKHQLQGRLDDISFEDYEVFGNFHSPNEDEELAALPGAIRATGVTSVVAAVGA